MRQSTGEFQLSLGFIVGIVFAVVLLSLALTWLQGIFSSLSGITDDVIEIAREEVINKIKTGANVEIAAATVTEWKRGESGAFVLGIRNDNPQSLTTFYINVYLEQVGGGLTDPAALSATANGWLSYAPTLDIEPSGIGTLPITIEPGASATPGTYHFRATVCDSEPAEGFASCHATSPLVGFDAPSPELYGSKTFVIRILP